MRPGGGAAGARGLTARLAAAMPPNWCARVVTH